MVYEIWSLGHKPFKEYSKHEVIGKVDSGFRLPSHHDTVLVSHNYIVLEWLHF